MQLVKGKLSVRIAFFHLWRSDDMHERCRVKVYRVQLPANNAYYDLQEEAAQSKAQKFKDKQCEQHRPVWC